MRRITRLPDTNVLGQGSQQLRDEKQGDDSNDIKSSCNRVLLSQVAASVTYLPEPNSASRIPAGDINSRNMTPASLSYSSATPSYNALLQHADETVRRARELMAAAPPISPPEGKPFFFDSREGAEEPLSAISMRSMKMSDSSPSIIEDTVFPNTIERLTEVMEAMKEDLEDREARIGELEAEVLRLTSLLKPRSFRSQEIQVGPAIEQTNCDKTLPNEGMPLSGKREDDAGTDEFSQDSGQGHRLPLQRNVSVAKLKPCGSVRPKSTDQPKNHLFSMGSVRGVMSSSQLQVPSSLISILPWMNGKWSASPPVLNETSAPDYYHWYNPLVVHRDMLVAAVLKQKLGPSPVLTPDSGVALHPLVAEAMGIRQVGHPRMVVGADGSVRMELHREETIQ